MGAAEGTFTPVPSASTVYTNVADLKPFSKTVNLKVIVIQQVEAKQTKDGHLVGSFLVADATGSVVLNLWDEVGAAVRPADILQILGGFVTLFKGFIRLACKVGAVARVGTFSLLFKEDPNMSLVEWTPDPKNPSSLIPRKKSHPHSTPSSSRRKRAKQE